ncbi:Pus1, partial [Symbiodinium necroappetens]
EFVHQSIVQWYGSIGAFNAYVQGPLRQELLKSSSFQMPFIYFLVILTPGQGSSLEELLGLLKAGAGAGATWQVVMSHILAHNVGLCIAVMFSLKFLFMQCERFAAPRQHFLLDCLTSVLIFLAFGLVTLLLAGLSLASAYFGIFTALAWAVVMLAAACMSFKGNSVAFSCGSRGL